MFFDGHDLMNRFCTLTQRCSGMGTAFPHKKLSGNGVPTREILRDIFLLLLLN